MSKTTASSDLICPVCQGQLERTDGVETCPRCGWAPRQGAD